MNIINSESDQSDIDRAWQHKSSRLIWTPKPKSGKSGIRQSQYIQCATPQEMIRLYALHKKEPAWRVSAKADFLFDLRRNHVHMIVSFKPRVESSEKVDEQGQSVGAQVRRTERTMPLDQTAPQGPALFPLFNSPTKPTKKLASIRDSDNDPRYCLNDFTPCDAKIPVEAKLCEEVGRDSELAAPLVNEVTREPEEILVPQSATSTSANVWNPIPTFAGLAAATSAAAEASVHSLTAALNAPAPLPQEEQSEDGEESSSYANSGQGLDSVEPPSSHTTPLLPSDPLLKTGQSAEMTASETDAPTSSWTAPLSVGLEYDASWLLNHDNSDRASFTRAVQKGALSPFKTPPPKRRFSYRDALFQPGLGKQRRQQPSSKSPSGKRPKVLFEGDSRGAKTVPRLLLTRNDERM